MAEQAGSEEISGCWGRAGFGCATVLGGWFGGGIIAIMVLKILSFFTRVGNCNDLPVPCNWYKFAFAGAVVGAIGLPGVLLWKMRRRPPGEPGNDHTDRG
ncbi:MAG TPA: hypothetical protein VFS08_02980 [Gemmatimonadaceae bacterium]|nr:hypothetical protein [Gemmatimonadaceae bacterium]